MPLAGRSACRCSRFLWLAIALFADAAHAQVPPYPSGFKTQELAVYGTKLHGRVGGKGPAVTLIHGYGETGDMWAPMAADLMKDHTVVVPDLRGMGRSAHPAGSFDKKNQGVHIAQVLDALKIDKTDLVTHDIGNMVGFAFAAQHRDRLGDLY